MTTLTPVRLFVRELHINNFNFLIHYFHSFWRIVVCYFVSSSLLIFLFLFFHLSLSSTLSVSASLFLSLSLSLSSLSPSLLLSTSLSLSPYLSSIFQPLSDSDKLAMAISAVGVGSWENQTASEKEKLIKMEIWKSSVLTKWQVPSFSQ